MYAPTLSQQFINAIHMQMLKYPMISKIENKTKSGMRERDIWHQILMWKTSEKIKNHESTIDKKIYYEE